MSGAATAVVGPPHDRFLLWPLALTIAWPLVAMLVSILPLIGFMIFVPLLAVSLWMPSAVLVLGLAVMWLKQRAWRRFSSALIFPALTLVAAANYDASRLTIRQGGDLIHLWAMMPFYRAALAKLPADRGLRLAYFDWEGWASISFGALYDESGEVEKPADQRSAAWKARAAAGLACEIIGWLPAGGHFYVVELGC